MTTHPGGQAHDMCHAPSEPVATAARQGAHGPSSGAPPPSPSGSGHFPSGTVVWAENGACSTYDCPAADGSTLVAKTPLSFSADAISHVVPLPADGGLRSVRLVHDGMLPKGEVTLWGR